MNKEELYDLIERYLDDALPDAERREVEQRVAADAAFRAEVELHRAMQQHLADPDELRLRAALDGMRGTLNTPDTIPRMKPGANFSIWRRYWAAAAAILVLLVALFWWLQPSPPMIEQPVVENPSLPPTDADKTPGQEDVQNPAPPVPDKQQQPIAMADPADFAVNVDLEEMMSSGLRGSGEEVVLLKPDSAAVFKRRSDNAVNILFHVRVNPDLVSDDQPFKLFIFSNKMEDWEEKKPLFSRDLSLVNVNNTAYEAQFNQKLSLAPGLYYLVIRQKRQIESDDPYRTRRVTKFSVLQ